MLPLYFVFLLAASAFSLDFPCKEGVEIKTEVTNNPADLIGNWSFVYHWDKTNNQSSMFPQDSNAILQCAQIEIEPVAVDYVKEKLDKCAAKDYPFKLEDAKLKLNAPSLQIKDSIIFIGEKESWMFADCIWKLRLVTRKLSDDIIVMINPEKAHISEMLSRKPISISEMNCLARNVDVGKGMNGIGMCA